MNRIAHLLAPAAALLGLLATPGTAQAAQTLEVVSGPDATRSLTVAAFDPVGQSFTAFTDTLTSIGFQFTTLNSNAANSDLTLSILAGETLSGASLFSKTFALPTTIAARGDVEWLDIALPDVVVKNGTFYTAVLTATSNRAALVTGPDFNVRTGQFSGGDAYLGGQLLSDSRLLYGNCRGAANNCDANFRVSGDVLAGAVPEPGTWAMLILGFAIVGSALRKRTRPTARLRAHIS